MPPRNPSPRRGSRNGGPGGDIAPRGPTLGVPSRGSRIVAPLAGAMAEVEYHRVEDPEEDSPPGEEELLLHVTEGRQGGRGGVAVRGGTEARPC